MKSSEILLSLQHHDLVVFKNIHGNICVQYHGAYIKCGIFIECNYGCGNDFESACDDYLKLIRGKTLVFNPHSKSRKEVNVL